MEGNEQQLRSIKRRMKSKPDWRSCPFSLRQSLRNIKGHDGDLPPERLKTSCEDNQGLSGEKVRRSGDHVLTIETVEKMTHLTNCYTKYFLASSVFKSCEIQLAFFVYNLPGDCRHWIWMCEKFLVQFWCLLTDPKCFKITPKTFSPFLK